MPEPATNDESNALPDKFECYELCVQSPRHVVAFIRAAHGREPVVLREDFCGSAAISRQWATEGLESGETRRAVAVDISAPSVARAVDLARAENALSHIAFFCGDVLEEMHYWKCATTPSGGADPQSATDAVAPDVIFVGNFSLGYIHERAALVQYLKDCRTALRRGNAGLGNGAFVCDTYGGARAFKTGGFERIHPGRRGEIIRYTWSRDAADPVTGMVDNSISFRIEVGGEVVQELPRAFFYRWRLWSIAELREALLEAGFAGVSVHIDANIAPGQVPRGIASPAELGDDWIVLIVGRV